MATTVGIEHWVIDTQPLPRTPCAVSKGAMRCVVVSVVQVDSGVYKGKKLPKPGYNSWDPIGGYSTEVAGDE